MLSKVEEKPESYCHVLMLFIEKITCIYLIAVFEST